ncbi:hypothetical protein THAOC_23296, partial [Thalassiosira oceanica]
GPRRRPPSPDPAPGGRAVPRPVEPDALGLVVGVRDGVEGDGRQGHGEGVLLQQGHEAGVLDEAALPRRARRRVPRPLALPVPRPAGRRRPAA